MLLILLCLLTPFSLSADEYFDQGKEFAEELKRKIAESKISHQKSSPTPSRPLVGKKCTSLSPPKTDPDTSLYICMSFSLPDAVWLGLSKEMENLGGIMVLRGIPNNSFKDLAQKLHSLRLQGMRSTVQIHPELFSKFAVSKVPCFVKVEEGSFNKLSGNVSLGFALEKLRTGA